MRRNNEISKHEPDLELSDEQKEILLKALNWATDDLTAQEAFNYYNKN